MLLLITDTSGKHGRVALARAADSSSEIHMLATVPLVGGTFSAQLVPQIAALLANHSLSKADIDAFIVISGPGSFTGLRVVLAAIKALAEILQKPIVPVSLLEVVAVASGRQGRVLPALDAGRGEVYVGEYDLDEESAKALQEILLSKADFLKLARESTVATSDHDLAASVAPISASVAEIASPTADQIARVGLRKLRAGEIVSPEQLEANYIRRSDAEIFSKPNL